jgi:hypothetical protein
MSESDPTGHGEEFASPGTFLADFKDRMKNIVIHCATLPLDVLATLFFFYDTKRYYSQREREKTR